MAIATNVASSPSTLGSSFGPPVTTGSPVTQGATLPATPKATLPTPGAASPSAPISSLGTSVFSRFLPNLQSLVPTSLPTSPSTLSGLTPNAQSFLPANAVPKTTSATSTPSPAMTTGGATGVNVQPAGSITPTTPTGAPVNSDIGAVQAAMNAATASTASQNDIQRAAALQAAQEASYNQGVAPGSTAAQALTQRALDTSGIAAQTATNQTANANNQLALTQSNQEANRLMTLLSDPNATSTTKSAAMAQLQAIGGLGATSDALAQSFSPTATANAAITNKATSLQSTLSAMGVSNISQADLNKMAAESNLNNGSTDAAMVAAAQNGTLDTYLSSGNTAASVSTALNSGTPLSSLTTDQISSAWQSAAGKAAIQSQADYSSYDAVANGGGAGQIALLGPQGHPYKILTNKGGGDKAFTAQDLVTGQYAQFTRENGNSGTDLTPAQAQANIAKTTTGQTGQPDTPAQKTLNVAQSAGSMYLNNGMPGLIKSGVESFFGL